MDFGNESTKSTAANERLGTAASREPPTGPASSSIPVSPVSTVGYAKRAPSAPAASGEMLQRHPAHVGVPEGLQTMSSSLRVATLKQDSALLEERIRFFAEELEEAHRVGLGDTLVMLNVGALPRITVRFDEHSAEVRIDECLLGALGNTVRSANRIYLHSHSDAFVASDAASQLAIRRAVEVRNVLVSLDVEPERIRLFYRGVGNFVANNSTPEGRAQNRRVEIELRKW